METLDILGNVDASGRGLTVEQLEQQRILAVPMPEIRPLRRVQPHPVYRHWRGAENKTLLWRGMSALVALGAMMLISTL
jgi:hypothetical protein